MSGGASPCDFLIKQEPYHEEQDDDGTIRVKAEPQHGDTWVKLEPGSLEVREQIVKEEPSCGESSGGPSEDERQQDLHLLYEGHALKGEELAIEVEVWQQPAPVVRGGHGVKEEMPISPEVLQQPITESVMKGLQEPSNHSSKLSSCGNGKKNKKKVHKQVSCDNCDKKYNSNCALSRHQWIHTGKKRFECDECGDRFTQKSSLKTHLRRHSGEKPFTCDICYKKFTVRESLTKHLFIHGREKPYICDICNKKFISKSLLSYHQNIHTGEKLFKCNICEKGFKMRRHLTAHLHIHSGEKPYSCDICSKKFRISSKLTNHLLIHSREKKFTCDICYKKFSQRGPLINHLRVHSGGRPPSLVRGRALTTYSSRAAVCTKSSRLPPARSSAHAAPAPLIMADNKNRAHCIVDGCQNKTTNKSLSFFSLPKEEERRNKWLNIIGRPDLMIRNNLKPKSHLVCSVHFEKKMILQIPRLHPDAMPTKCLLSPSSNSTITCEMESSTAKKQDT